jgi:riboflavin synthase
VETDRPGFVADGAGNVGQASSLSPFSENQWLTQCFILCQTFWRVAQKNPKFWSQARRLTYFMFTGIIEEAGIVERIRPTAKSVELTVCATTTGHGLKVGGSVAVNGCCLTAVNISTRGKSKLVRFDLLQETWRLTNLQFTKPGSLVNLERPLRADGEFGGHFVTGHIDGLGKIIRWERTGQDHVLDIAAPPEVMRYVVRKGSMAVDGISLTVAGVQKKSFRIWIIPHTFEVTALREREVGNAVNLEADLLGKYMEKFISARRHK